MIKTMAPLLLASLLLACGNNNHTTAKQYEKRGSIEFTDSALNNLIDKDAEVEIIADSFIWSEGPLWVEQEKMLLFSDVPANIVYKWTEEKGKEIYLTPSGYTSNIKRGGEIGSNGLGLTNDGKLVLCQDGDRQVAWMDAPLTNPNPAFKTITNNYQSKKYNSPNDLVYNQQGELFFTDPPYGLERGMEDSLKEIPFQGVYKVKTNGEVILLTDTLTRPNGIGLTNNGKTLIVANSDPAHPYWYAYDVSGDSLTNARIFYSAAEAAKTDQGMPDGFKVDSKGNLWASGPGGIWIFDKNEKVLGRIKFPGAVSNCSLSGDEKTLYMTADMYILRVKLRK